MTNISRRAVIIGSSSIAAAAIFPAVAGDTEIADFVASVEAAHMDIVAATRSGKMSLWIGTPAEYIGGAEHLALNDLFNRWEAAPDWQQRSQRIIDYLVQTGRTSGVVA